MTYLTAFNIFFIYSFFGWCIEVIFSSITKKKFINRGFLNGPYCPIYGVSGLFLNLIIVPLDQNFFINFVLSAISVTIIELIVGLILLKIFKRGWWDYSKEKFNFKGIICLKFTFFWGLLCALLVTFINPLLLHIVGHLPNSINWTIVIIIIIIFCFDIIITILHTISYTKHIIEIQEFAEILSENANKIGSKMSDFTITSMEKINSLIEKVNKDRLTGFFKRIKLFSNYFNNDLINNLTKKKNSKDNNEKHDK